MSILRHIHLSGLTRYAAAQKLQESLARRLLDHKAAVSAGSATDAQAPPPTVITAQFHPVYTLGRREKLSTRGDEYERLLRQDGADVFEATRGGQTTFHGPGQLIAYPIINLSRHGLTARDYSCLLEKMMIETCAHYHVRAFRTEHTGVWTSSDRKIGALGIHLRRHVTLHGIGLNVSTDLAWFDRIVACGLADKKATSLEREKQGKDRLNVEDVANIFVDRFAKSLSGVDRVDIESAPLES